MSLFQPFIDARGPLRAVDARVRLLGAVVFSVTVAVLSDMRVLAAALGVAAGLLILIRPRPGVLLRRLLAANAFVAFLWLFLPWSTPGAAVAQWGPITITTEGLRLSLMITIKCNAIISAMIALLATMPVRELAAAMSRLRLPGRLVTLFYLTVRYIHVVHGESMRMRQAAAVRCFRPRTDLLTYRTYANFVGSLLVRSVDRAERIYAAMRCRGFSGCFPRFSHAAARVGDWVFLAAICCAAMAMGCCQWLLNR